MRLSNKVAIVTGAGRGIGASIARACAREGCSVVVNYFTSNGPAEEVVRSIVDEGGRAIAVKCNVGDLSAHDSLIAAAMDSFGRLDILINNAGIEKREPFLQATPENWDFTVDVNLKGAYFLSQRAARQMVAQTGGKILNISSVHDHSPHYNNSVYSITKGGMKMMTRCLALELAEYGINVNSLAPGAILTDINREVLAESTFRDQLIHRIPCKRIGDVEDIAGAAVFLVSAEAGYITGATLYVDGGLLLQS